MTLKMTFYLPVSTGYQRRCVHSPNVSRGSSEEIAIVRPVKSGILALSRVLDEFIFENSLFYEFSVIVHDFPHNKSFVLI